MASSRSSGVGDSNGDKAFLTPSEIVTVKL